MSQVQGGDDDSYNNQKKKRLKILVALSGGVDSSVATQLLVNEGHDISAVFLKFWQDKDSETTIENAASSAESYQDAKAVAEKIGMPFFSLDLSSEFKKEVVDYFLKEYASGRTPNPCVACNREIKIGLLLKKALALGYDGLATGHYLRIEKKEGATVSVFRAEDRGKDQTYFLYTLKQDQLQRLFFPLAKYKKTEVRELAKQSGLITAKKKESQDICFIHGLHNDFLKKHLKLEVGEIRLKETGELKGHHQGLALYTLGQRKGIEIGGTGPYYVAAKELGTNTLWVTAAVNELILEKKEFLVSELNFIDPVSISFPLKCQVSIRYGQKPMPAIIDVDQDSLVKVILEKGARAVVSGQSAVFYREDELLGGGIVIDSEQRP